MYIHNIQFYMYIYGYHWISINDGYGLDYPWIIEIINGTWKTGALSTENGQKMMDIHGLSMLSGYPNDSIENT